MIYRRVLLSACFVLLAALSFFRFPGHTYLQSDTQIYIPILEHLWDPSVLARDLVAIHPHVSFTIYDEVVFGLRHITGLGFEPLLLGQEFVYRLIGIAGLYLLGTGLGLSAPYSLLMTAILSLGATVNGPAVLTVEYEPIPRGFALAFVLLALGLIAHDHWDAAAVFAGVGFLFHPPTALAFFAIYLVISLRRRRIDVDALLIGAAVVMLAFVIAQRSFLHAYNLVATIAPWLEDLQRMRSSYNWVELWMAKWVWHYLFVFSVGWIAYHRVQHRIPPVLRGFVVGLPVIGMLGVPASYLFLSKMKLSVMPQLQPGRYLLFVTLTGVLLAAVAAIDAAAERRYMEAFAFFSFCFAVPMEPNIIGESWQHYLLAMGLGGLATAAASLYGTRWSIPAVALAALVPFFTIPTIGHVRNYPAIHSQDLNDLAQWARTSTAQDAVFQFAEVGRRLEPGIFRARSLRALYVDWKGGGQVNFMKEFAEVWRDRWQKLQNAHTLQDYSRMGIDYVVYPLSKALPNVKPVYRNGSWVVYAVSAPGSGLPLSAMAQTPVLLSE